MATDQAAPAVRRPDQVPGRPLGPGVTATAGTSIYLPPYQPHGLENTGQDPLEVLGVFYPAGSPAAKQTS